MSARETLGRLARVVVSAGFGRSRALSARPLFATRALDSGNVASVSDEGSSDVKNDEAGAPSASSVDEGTATVDPSTLRVPKPEGASAPRAIRLKRMVARVDDPHPIPIDALPSPGGLTFVGPHEEIERLLARGDVEGARERLKSITGDGPEAIAARGITARAALMEGELSVAKEALGPHSDDDALAAAAAVVALTEGDVERAIKKATAAHHRTPNGVVESYTMALVRVGMGDLDEARALLVKVAASVPEHAVARHQLGQLILASGDPARAGTLFEMAIQIAPDFVPPALSLAEMFIDGRQLGEAMNLLASITEKRPGLLSPRLMQLRVLLAVGELDGAKNLVDALYAAAADVPEIALSWCEVRARRGELDAAVTKLEDLRGHVDRSVKERALRLLAQIDLAMEPPKKDDAAEKLEEACAAVPENAELRFETAQLQFGRGDGDAARVHLEALAGIPHLDLSILLSGAVLAANHGQWKTARLLGNTARARVIGTPAERQIEGFLEQLPSE